MFCGFPCKTGAKKQGPEPVTQAGRPQRTATRKAWIGGAIALALLAGCAMEDSSGNPVETAALTVAAAPRVSDAPARSVFGQAVARAVTAHPDLALGGAEVRAAQAARHGAEGAFIPDVSVGIGAESSRAGGVTSSNTSPFLRVSQLVYDAGAARAGLEAARARETQRIADRTGLAAAAALEAVEVWRGVSDTRRLLGLARQNRATLGEIADRIATRAESGAGTAADTLTAQSRLADADTRIAEAQVAARKAEARFASLFGQPPAGLSMVPAPALPAGGADVLRSPRLVAAAAAVEAAQADLEAARARRSPRVELGATGQRATGGGSDIGLDLSLTYSLDTRRDRIAAVEQAEAALSAAEAARDGLARDISEALAFVRADRDGAEARLRAARSAADSAAGAATARQEQFATGRSSLVDLLDAQRETLRTREVLVAAESDRFLTGYAALALTGDILDAFGITLPDPSAP